jgi:mycothiol synthase
VTPVNEDPGHAEPSIVTVQPRLSAREVAELQKLVEEAARHDGTYPLNEHAVLHLRGGGGPHAEHVVARAGGTMVGYGLLDSADRSPGATGELVVVPDHRRRGVGAALAEAMLAVAPAPLRLWAHGDQPAAERLAASLGFDRVRELWQMRLDLAATSLDAAPELPPRVSVRTFAPGADEGAWLEVNARAFAEHPEQGALTMDGLKARIAEPWFDPSGFFLAERDGQIVGFHWTKVHGGSGGHAHPPIGEVYVVGVDPASRGLGLGRILTVIGLRHLRQRGVHEVMLYVDADNAAGVRTYRRLGFVHHSTDVMYSQAG